MHMLMSFIGCIVTFMKGTGLENIFRAAFGGVASMLNGKAWPKALRGLRMVVSAVLEDTIRKGTNTPEDLGAALETASENPTGQLWVDCPIFLVLIVHMFIRAERNGDWLLHLFCTQQMIGYFFAAGHWNYAGCGVWYVQEMQGAFPSEARAMFMNGEHVSRHRDGVWNSVFSDQFGEQTYILYGKVRGGLVGAASSPDQVAGWVMSYHICNTVILSLDNMFESEDTDEEFDQTKQKHKEEGKKRRIMDAEDRQKIRNELQKHTHSLKTKSDKILNIVNGRLANTKVNAHKAIEIGQSMAQTFKSQLPGGFYEPIKKEVVTMEVLSKGVKIGDKIVYDMERLYARMLVVSQKRQLDLEHVFS
jgi:hypothetical protein